MNRTCSRCGKSKPEDRFYRRPGRPGGRQYHCKDCDQERRVETRLAHPEWQVNADLHRHGISLSEYQEMLAVQGGCAVCGATEPGGHGRFHVDHDHNCCPGSHSCGKCIRGLLCNRCNTGIGQFKDNPSRLESAARYLRRYNNAGEVMP